MIPDPQVITLRFDVGIHHLVIEKLGALWLSSDPPVVEIEQAAKESQLSLLVEHFNAHQVVELAHEGLHSLVQPPQVLFDLRAQ
jgi:hypothetical protein